MDAKNVINRLIRTASGGGQNRDDTVGFGVVRPYNAVFDNVPTVSDWPLGYPSAAPTTSHPAAAASSDGSLRALGFAAAGLLLLAIVLVAVLVIVLVARRSKAPAGQPPAPPAPPVYPPQPPGPQ
jgi:membrane-anchored mycosin MYCP